MLIDIGKLGLIPSKGGGVPAPQVLNSIMALDGDSHIAQELALIGGGNGDMEGRFGWAIMSRQIAKSPGFIPVGGNFGVAGQRLITQIYPRRAATFAIGAKVLLLSAGGNDVAQNETAGDILACFDSYFSDAYASGIVFIEMTTVPVRFGANAFTAPQEVVRQAVNAGLRARANARLKVIDLDPIITNVNQTSDNIHLNGKGSIDVALVAGPVLAGLYAPGSDAASLLVPGTAVVPSTTGTGGTITSAAGVAATGCTLAANQAGGATVTGSKDTDDKQIIAVSGAKTGSNAFARFRSTKSAAQWGLTVAGGDTVYGVIDFEVLSPFTGVGSLEVEIAILDSGFATTFLDLRGLHVFSAEGVLPAGRYTMRTPPGVVRTGGTPANMNIDANVCFLNNSVSVGGAFKIHSFGLVKP